MRRRILMFFTLTAMFVVSLTLIVSAAEKEGIFTYTVSSDKATVTKIDWNGLEEISIPQTLGGYPVTAIGSGVMTDTTYNFGDDNVTVIHIPETVTSINSGAFDFADISRFDVDSENPVYSSDEAGVLFNKDKTLLIKAANSFDTAAYEIPGSVTEIGKSAFNSSLFVKSVTVPDSVTKIGDQAFFQALSLEHIRLSENITLIDQNVFARCSSLEEITVPSNVSVIRNSAFTECDALKKVIISEGVTSLDEYAFESDVALEYVFLPSTLTNIKSGVFGNCPSLTDICYAGTQQDFENINIVKGAYYGDRVNAVDSASVHFEIDTESYENIDFSDENDILVISGEGATPTGSPSSWHYWDQNKDTVVAVIIEGDIEKIGSYSFSDFPALTTLIVRSDRIDIEPRAFAGCPLLENVVIFSDSSFESSSFTSCASSMRVFEEKNASHSFNLSSTSINVISFDFSSGILNFGGNVALDAYEFFDMIAVFAMVYDDIEKITFTNLTFENITMFYYLDDGFSMAKIEDNTLVNGEIYPAVYENGENKPITFNALTSGISDMTVTEFTLIAKDEKHSDIKDTEIEVKEELSFIGKVLRWVVTLLNKLFSILSRFG